MTNISNTQWLPSSIPWVPCFNDVGDAANITWQCANLTVPVDYQSSDNKTTQLGLAKAHTNGSPNSDQRAFFVNWGGPGVSSIIRITSSVPSYFDIVGQNHDVILMDPRGTGWSRFLTCGFSSEAYEAQMNFTSLSIEALALGHSLLTPQSLELLTEMYMSWLGPFCEKSEDLEYLAHVNTPNVARDMDLVRKLEGYETIDYWGISYGTVLGTVYATMFPDHLGRIVLDGVVSFTEWMGITSDALDYEFHSLDQIPRILGEIAGFCVDAAKVNTASCQFAVASLNSSDPTGHLNDRIKYIVGNVTNGAYIESTGQHRVFSFDSVANKIAYNFYGPSQYPGMFQYLLDAENAIVSGTPSSNFSSDFDKRSVSNGQSVNVSFSSLNPSDNLGGSFNSIAMNLVSCLDASFQGIDNLTSYNQRLLTLVGKEPLIAYVSLDFSVCLGLPNLTSFNVSRITAPTFTASLKNKILVIGVTWDAITPYHGALATYQYLGPDNAVFLVHDGYGHTSQANTNNCTDFTVADYLQTGALPANGTYCYTDNTGPNNPFILALSSSNGTTAQDTAMPPTVISRSVPKAVELHFVYICLLIQGTIMVFEIF